MVLASDLEANGWKQGALVRREDIDVMLDGILEPVACEQELIVISQSCDLVQSNDQEPVVEAILAERISALDGNYTFNKNPRTLHLPMRQSAGADQIVENVPLRIAAKDKLGIPKSRFYGKQPDREKAIQSESLRGLVSWLAARYSRPALPTSFNDALDRSDAGRKKRKKYAQRASPHTSGIYVEITPNREIMSGENYSVNVLGVLLPSATEHRAAVEDEIRALGDLMTNAGMDVHIAVQTEDEVSISTLKRFQRLYFDDLSFRSTHDPLPVEVQPVGTTSAEASDNRL